jgi:CubicO group peptidase (beta-lactamase class C family)
MIRLTSVISSLVASMAILVPGAPAQQPAGQEKKLVEAVDRLVRQYGFTDDGPGLAIYAVQPGKIAFKKGYGLANLKTGARITSQTIFELASLTRPFTAMAVLLLHEQKKLDLNDPVRRHIQEFPSYQASRPIRIRDLLQHTSGIPDYLEFPNLPLPRRGYFTNEDFADQFARQQDKFPLAFAPEDKHQYSNSNYMLASLVIQRVTRKSYGKFLQEAIFQPLGMTGTYVYESPQSVPRVLPRGATRAIGYEREPGTGKWQPGWGAPPDREETLLTTGDGAIWSNLDDLARWDLALREGRLLDPKSINLVLTPSRTRDGQSNPYGLGFSLYDDDAGALIGYGHDGALRGFRTSYYRYLARDRTTILLSNRGDFDPDKFWYELDAVFENSVP